MTNYRMTTRLKALALATALLAGAGCTQSAFDAQNGNIVQPGSVNNATGLGAYLNGALQDFGYANAGDDSNQEGQILLSGMLADEFESYDTFPTRKEIDQRQMQVSNATLETAERAIQRARAGAAKAAAQYIKFGPDQTSTISKLLTISALSTISMAENYCSAVPLSTFSGDTITYGQPQTTNQLLTTAIAQLDSALTFTPGYNFAAVVKGRALVDLGQFANAAAAVAAVPDNYVSQEFHTVPPSSTVNGVYSFFAIRRGYSMPYGSEGGVGLDYQNSGDPRVAFVQGASAQAGSSIPSAVRRVLQPAKYSSKSSPVTIASGVEARLIEAEAAINTPGGTFISKINAARAQAGLGPVADPDPTASNLSARRDLLFKERAFALHATGHRLGDLRRLVKQYGLTVNQVYPNGAYFRGGAYGTDVNLPISLAETNNPNFTTAQCDTKTP